MPRLLSQTYISMWKVPMLYRKYTSEILPGCRKRLTSVQGSCAAAQSPISQQQCRSRNKQTVDDARSSIFLLAPLFSSTQLENISWKILGSFFGGIGETGLQLSSGWRYQAMVYFNNKTRQYYTLVEQKAILLIFISIIDKNINLRSKWNWQKGQFELIQISIDSSIYSCICLCLEIEKNINWSQYQSDSKGKVKNSM